MDQTDVSLISVDYEVRGKVQGVCFRAYTREMAKKNQLVGWVKNTMSGTVVGCAQGEPAKVKLLKRWLEHTGSPDSEIAKCTFSNEREIPRLEFCNFIVRH